MDTTIEEITGQEILDSRGNPTVEVEVVLADGSWDAQPFRPEHPPAFMRHSSCGWRQETLWRQGRTESRCSGQ